MIIIRSQADAIRLVSYLSRNVFAIFTISELIDLIKISKYRKLRLKLGFDPTGSSLHIGHVALLFRVREFLNLIPSHLDLILGDITVVANSPERKQKKIENSEIESNIETIKNQIFFLFNGMDSITIHRNSDWFKNISIVELLPLLKDIDIKTISDKFQVSNFPVSSAVYPILQAYDSKYLETDIEFGGSDQLCSVLVGREIVGQVCFLTRLLPGLNINTKMSKSDPFSAIFLNDTPEIMLKKMSKLTDEIFFEYVSIFGWEFNVRSNREISLKRSILSQNIINEVCCSGILKSLSVVSKHSFFLTKPTMLLDIILNCLSQFSKSYIKSVFKQKGVRLNKKICNINDKIIPENLSGIEVLSFGKFNEIEISK